jgi:pilus assembly protein CpaF
MKQVRVVDNFGNEYFYPIEQTVAEISIGRSQGNDIILGSKTVSRRHAILKIMGDRVLLVNQSANGCMVNGERVDRVRELRVGEQAQIDIYLVSVEDANAPRAAAPASPVSRSFTDAPPSGPASVPMASHGPTPSGPVSGPTSTGPRPAPPKPRSNPSGRDMGTREMRSTEPEDVWAFLGFLHPDNQPEEPRVNLTGTNVEVVPREKRQELVRYKSQLHEELKERLDLHSFEITDYASPRVVRQVSEKLKELLQINGHLIPPPFTRDMVFKELMDEVCGLGPIEDLIKHRKVSEVMVVDRDHIYAELAGKLVLTDRFFNDEKSMMTVIERIVIPRGRRIDESTPLVDTRLADGSRVNAVIPPLALKDPCVTIRKFPEDRLGIGDLIRFKSMTPEMGKFLARAVRGRKNLIISGGTGSGKTTLLNVLSSFIGPQERVVTIEDAAELQLQQEHVVSLETKPPNLEGKGAIEIRDLVKNALRMRPDRIVVGECRGGEALDMLQAMNTGHDGSMTTVHSNSPIEAISRLETLVLMSGMELPTRAIREQIANSVNIIVQQTRFSDGSRRITYISEVVGIDDDGFVQIEDIYRYKQTGIDEKNKVQGYHLATGYLPSFVQEFIVKGLASAEDFF